MIDQLEELYPDDHFEIDGEYIEDTITSYGEPVLELVPIDPENWDYDNAPKYFTVMFDNYTVADKLDDFDEVLEVIEKNLFRD